MYKKRIVLTVLFLLATNVYVTQGELVDGLVSYWSFDDDFSATVGGSEYDLTGYGTVGTSSIASEGKFGSAVEFDRDNSEYLKTITGTTYTPGSDMTYQAWYRLDETISGYDRYFIMETPGDNLYPISYGLRESDSVDIGQVYMIPDGSSVNSYFNVAGGATTGEWHSIIVTFDADLNGGTYAGYLDGEYAGEMSNVGVPAAGTGLVIGGSRSGAGRNFEGLIDDVAIWDRALTADEISTLQVQAVPEPGTFSLLAAAFFSLIGFRKFRADRLG